MPGKAPIYKVSRSKAPKTQQICHYRHARNTIELFYCMTMGGEFSSRNNFAQPKFLCKSFRSCRIYNFLI